MDEEAPKPKKITAANLFESIITIQDVAGRALTTSQENLLTIKANDELVKGIQESIQIMEEDISNITNYFIIQQENREKQLEQREQQTAKQEDQLQKRADEQEKGLEDQKDKTFLDSLRKGAANVVRENQGGLITAGLAFGLTALGTLTGFEEGGDPPINKPALVGEGGPEVFIPKTSGTIIPNDVLKDKTFKLSGRSKDLIGGNKQFLSGIQKIADKHNIKAAELLGLIASESSFKGDALNETSGAGGLIQFKPEIAKEFGTSVDDIRKMSLVDQLPLIDRYLSKNLPKNATTSQLYGSVFMPSYADRGPDFQLLGSGDQFDDGEKINSTIRARYERNSGLDLDGDGFISVGELGSRIKNKMSDFGIEDLTLPEEDLSSITLPPIGDTGGNPELAQTSAPFDNSSVGTNEISDTESDIPFIDVISNPFLSVA
tara:strand:- start:427 stop:1725 length:1299 start_codon:yes stop_codon:yes gene_type:complete